MTKTVLLVLYLVQTAYGGPAATTMQSSLAACQEAGKAATSAFLRSNIGGRAWFTCIEVQP